MQVIQERVPLRRSGTHVEGAVSVPRREDAVVPRARDKGFFKCFGCGVGGDVIKFVELYDKVAFPEAVRQLAARVGLPVPEPESTPEDAEDQRDREALLKAHEMAAALVPEQLAAAGGGGGAAAAAGTRRDAPRSIGVMAVGLRPRDAATALNTAPEGRVYSGAAPEERARGAARRGDARSTGSGTG